MARAPLPSIHSLCFHLWFNHLSSNRNPSNLGSPHIFSPDLINKEVSNRWRLYYKILIKPNRQLLQPLIINNRQRLFPCKRPKISTTRECSCSKLLEEQIPLRWWWDSTAPLVSSKITPMALLINQVLITAATVLWINFRIISALIKTYLEIQSLKATALKI